MDSELAMLKQYGPQVPEDIMRRLVSIYLYFCHAIDNPSMDSELAMLKQYGPQVPEDIMRRLVSIYLFS